MWDAVQQCNGPISELWCISFIVLHVYLHTYIHTYVHTYVHTCMQQWSLVLAPLSSLYLSVTYSVYSCVACPSALSADHGGSGRGRAVLRGPAPPAGTQLPRGHQPVPQGREGAYACRVCSRTPSGTAVTALGELYGACVCSVKACNKPSTRLILHAPFPPPVLCWHQHQRWRPKDTTHIRQICGPWWLCRGIATQPLPWRLLWSRHATISCIAGICDIRSNNCPFIN